MITRIFHVSPSGNDSNTGLSVSAAFRTLQKAANGVSPGDVVLVHPGTYAGFGMGDNFPQGGTADHPGTYPNKVDTTETRATITGLGNSKYYLTVTAYNNVSGTIYESTPGNEVLVYPGELRAAQNGILQLNLQ